jgi:hypothetical protein
MLKTVSAAATAGLLLAGCQTAAIDNDAERAVVGAGLAAGTAAVLDADVGTAAVAGAIGGAFCDDVGVCR